MLQKMLFEKLPQSWGWRLKKAGKTQDWLSKKLQCTPAKLSNNISGKTSPSWDFVVKVEKILQELDV